MTPDELATEVDQFIRLCTDRIVGIGAQQYHEEGKPQRFETMSFDALAEYYEEELRDIANYAAMSHIRLRRMRDEVSRRSKGPTLVCLCGSGRFREAFEQAEFHETMAGKIVLTIGCNTKDIARDVDWSHVKPMLDELHLRKIDLADEVLILNVDGYVGESTRSEIEYAMRAGKVIRYLEPVELAVTR